MKKTLLLVLSLFMINLSFSQVPNVFFSEYAEGSSNNKYLEIYNNSSETVDLTQFAFPNVSNDPAVVGEYEYWNTFPEGASVAPGEVYVIMHGSFDASQIDQADHTFQYLSNGDDGFKLVYGTEDDYTVVDVLGDFQGDPGSGWDVAGVSNGTQNHTLVRKSTVCEGTDSWSTSAGTTTEDSQWIVLDQDDWTNLGSHAVECGEDFTELLSFLASGNWRMLYEEAGYRGVGPASSYWAEWWSAAAGEDPSTHGMIDDSFSFTTDGGFSYDTGADGTITGKKPEIDANFDPTGENAYDADNGYNEYFNYPLDDFTDTFEVGSDGTYETITFAQNGGTQFYTSVAPQTFQIIERTETTMYLRNVGSEGNAWYMLVTNEELPVDPNCTFEVVVVSGGSYPSEVSWDITDASGTVLLSGDAYSDAQVIGVVYGTYTLNMYDSYGDGWNGAIVSVGGTEYTFSSGSVGSGEIVCEPYVCEYDVTMTSGGSYPSEISWEVTDASGAVVLAGDASTSGATLSVVEGEVYTLNMYDSYGDGWNGGVLNIGGTEYTFTSGSYASAEITCTNESGIVEITAAATGEYSGAVAFNFSMANFIVGTDGHIHYSINGGDEVMLYESSTVVANLPDGTHVMTAMVVDDAHQPIEGSLSASVEFTVSTLACDTTVSYDYGNSFGSGGGSTFDDNFTTGSAGDIYSTTYNYDEPVTVNIGGTTENNYDWIYVTNGAGEVLLAPVSGTLDYQVTSEDGVLNVHLSSDSTVTSGPFTIETVCGGSGLAGFLSTEGGWRYQYEVAGYRGVGSGGAMYAEWWNSQPYEDFNNATFPNPTGVNNGLVDDIMFFTEEGGFTFDTGEDGTIMGKKPEIDAAFDPTGENAYDADNGYNEYFNYPLDDFTDTYTLGNDGTYDTIEFATVGALGFYTSTGAQVYQILEQTDNTIYVRNVGSEGNSWYSMLTSDAHALSTSDNEILDMMVYPNPVDGNYVTILSPVEGLKEIQVFTVTGRKVMDTVINGNTLDVSSFNSGFYMLKVTINGQSKVSKLVVR